MFTFPQNQYFHLSFQTSKGTLKMLEITFCPQVPQDKYLKWSYNLNRVGYAADIWGIFYFQ